MPFLRQRADALAQSDAPLCVAALRGETLLSALPLALAAQERGREVSVATLSDEADALSFGMLIAEWNREQSPRLSLRYGLSPDKLPKLAPHVLFAFAPHEIEETAALGALRDEADAGVLVGRGASAPYGADEAEIDRLLATLTEHGGLLGVEALERFSPEARTWLEAVEHVHHRRGPNLQSSLADTIRAALFGRTGQVAVNLVSVDRPPAVDPQAAVYWFLRPSELLRWQSE